MKKILFGFIFGVIITTASTFWVTRNTEVTPDQLKLLQADRVKKSIEIDGTIVAILEQDTFITSNPSKTKIVIFPKSLSSQRDSTHSHIVFQMIDGKWENIYAADGNHRQIVANIDEGYSFKSASLYGSKHHNYDRNFDGFVDSRISKPFTGERQTEYFTANGTALQNKPKAPIYDESGNVVEVEWKESGYEIIRGG